MIEFLRHGIAYTRAIRTENLKYVERTPEWPSELFDLEADPGETRNVIEDSRHAKELAALRARLTRVFDLSGAPALAEWRSTTSQTLTAYSR